MSALELKYVEIETKRTRPGNLVLELKLELSAAFLMKAQISTPRCVRIPLCNEFTFFRFSRIGARCFVKISRGKFYRLGSTFSTRPIIRIVRTPVRERVGKKSVDNRGM